MARAKSIKEIVGYEGKIAFDESKLDGLERKLLNVSIINAVGWQYSYGLKSGLEKSYV